MRNKIGLFVYLFITTTVCNYLFVGDYDIWSALFVGFFSAVILAFVFMPLVEKPMMNLIKEIVIKLIK